VHYALQINLFQQSSTGDSTQRTGRCLGIEHHACLLQNPSFNFFVVNRQQAVPGKLTVMCN